MQLLRRSILFVCLSLLLVSTVFATYDIPDEDGAVELNGDDFLITDSSGLFYYPYDGYNTVTEISLNIQDSTGVSASEVWKSGQYLTLFGGTGSLFHVPFSSNSIADFTISGVDIYGVDALQDKESDTFVLLGSLDPSEWNPTYNDMYGYFQNVRLNGSIQLDRDIWNYRFKIVFHYEGITPEQSAGDEWRFQQLTDFVQFSVGTQSTEDAIDGAANEIINALAPELQESLEVQRLINEYVRSIYVWMTDPYIDAEGESWSFDWNMFAYLFYNLYQGVRDMASDVNLIWGQSVSIRLAQEGTLTAVRNLYDALGFSPDQNIDFDTNFFNWTDSSFSSNGLDLTLSGNSVSVDRGTAVGRTSGRIGYLRDLVPGGYVVDADISSGSSMNFIVRDSATNTALRSFYVGNEPVSFVLTEGEFLDIFFVLGSGVDTGSVSATIKADPEFAGWASSFASKLELYINTLVNAIENQTTEILDYFKSIYENYENVDLSGAQAGVQTNDQLLDQEHIYQQDVFTQLDDSMSDLNFDTVQIGNSTLTAMGVLLPYSNALFNVLGEVGLVLVFSLSCGIILLIIGRGFAALIEKTSSSSKISRSSKTSRSSKKG